MLVIVDVGSEFASNAFTNSSVLSSIGNTASEDVSHLLYLQLVLLFLKLLLIVLYHQLMILFLLLILFQIMWVLLCLLFLRMAKFYLSVRS